MVATHNLEGPDPDRDPALLESCAMNRRPRARQGIGRSALGAHRDQRCRSHAVQPLARRLATRLASRRRLGRAGRLDVRRTVRASMGSGGVPLLTRHRPVRA